MSLGTNPLRTSSDPFIPTTTGDDTRTPDRVVRAKGAASTFGNRGGIDTPVLQDIVSAKGNPKAARASASTVSFAEPLARGEDVTIDSAGAVTDSDANTREVAKLSDDEDSGRASPVASAPETKVDTKVEERKTYWLGRTAAIISGLLPSVALLGYALRNQEVSTVQDTIQGLLYPAIGAGIFATSKNASMFGTALLAGFLTYTALQFGVATSLEEQYLTTENLHTARMIVSGFIGSLSGKIHTIFERRLQPA